MASTTTTKWQPQEVIKSGREAIRLIGEDAAVFASRLKANESGDLSKGIETLHHCYPGQQSILSDQKAKTGAQGTAMEIAQKLITDSRRSISGATNDPAIRKAFGVGERISAGSVKSIHAAGLTFIEGYRNNKKWANEEAGIVDEDIADIQLRTDNVIQTDVVQEDTKISRKMKTSDKDKLQRTMEDLITKISAIGVRWFRTSDPYRMAFYENLIPSANRPPDDSGDTNPDQPETTS